VSESNLTRNDASRGNASSDTPTTSPLVAGGTGWFGKKWTPKDVGIERSETGHWRITWSAPNSLTADARAEKRPPRILPPETTFDEVKRAREEEIRKANSDWAQVYAARGQRTAERNRQRSLARYQAAPQTRLDTGIYERLNGRYVEWCEPHPVTGYSRLRAKRFSLDTPRETLRAWRETKLRDAERAWVPILEERKRKTEERRPLKEERARARRKRVARNICRDTKGFRVHRSEPDPVTGGSNRHWVRPPADHQTLESVERFRDELERKDEEVRARIREAKHRQAVANARETPIRIDTNISKVFRSDGRLRGFRVSVEHRPKTGPRRSASRRFPPNTAIKKIVRCREDLKKRVRSAAPAPSFAVHFQRLLDKTGWSHATAARKLGIGKATITRIMAGARPTETTLAKINKKGFRKYLGGPVSFVL